MEWHNDAVKGVLGLGRIRGPQFNSRLRQHLAVHPSWTWIALLNKGGPPIELPFLLGMQVQATRPLRMHPGKSRPIYVNP